MKPFEPGASVGKYQIVRLLNAGGMGMLYEARHPVLAHRLVVKTLRPMFGGVDEMAERFRNEALAASRLRDDRLPQIFDIDTIEDGTQYIVMEYLDGEDLAQRLLRGPLDPGYAARIVLEVLEVLGRVHRLGIVHRDIKPGNIFLARSDLLGEVPKLLDFGIAHIAESEITKAHHVIGTPAYMAPEQITGGAIGPWTDTFAAGIVLFELIAGSGQLPWDASSLQAYHASIVRGVPSQPLSSRGPQVPLGLDAVIARALLCDHTTRYADALAFVRDLEPFAIPRAALYHGGCMPTVGPADAQAAAGDKNTVAYKATAAVAPEVIAPLAGAPTVSAAPGPTPTVVPPVQASGFAPMVAKTAHHAMNAQRLAALRAQLGRIKPGQEPQTAAAGPIGLRLQPGERRPVMLVFFELQLQPTGDAHLSTEDAEALVRQLQEMITAEFDQRGATVQAQPDGGLMAIFGYTHIREDDAELAATAVLATHQHRIEASRLLADVNYTLLSRAGLHSGYATRIQGTEASIPWTSEAMSVAKRLAEHAPINGILASEDAVDQIRGLFVTRPMGKLNLKGWTRPVGAHELLGTNASSREGGSWTKRSYPQGLETTAFDVAPLVGRKEELARLASAFARLRQGTGGPILALIGGGAGLGKTRLVSEFLARLEHDPSRPPQICRIFPPPREPYGLWAQVLQWLVKRHPASDPDTMLDRAFDALGAGLTPERRAALEQQRPVISMLLGGSLAELAAEHSPQALADRIQHAVALALEGAARCAAPHPGDSPLVVALEDVHRADDASIALLGRVIDAIGAPTPLLLVVTVREGTARELPRAAECLTILLGPMDALEVAALARILARHTVLSPAACDFVLRCAGGNPLFVEELVDRLCEQGLASASAGRLRSFTPPTSLYALLLARVDRLEPRLRETLRVVSALGTEFERPLLSAVLEAAAAQIPELSSARTLLEALDELERLDILTRGAVDEGIELMGFRHAQMQGAMYGTILTENKRVLHRLTAEALERLYADRRDRHLSRILYHWSQTEELERTVHYARLAGQKAFAVGAYDEAQENLMMAVALQERIPEPSSMSAVRTLLDLARAYLWSGRITQSEAPATEAMSRLVALEAALPEAQRIEALLLRSQIGMTRAQIAELRARWEASITHFEEAERAFFLAGLPFDAARARCARGFMLRTAGRPEAGIELARDGWNVLKGSDNLAAVARAGHDLGNILRDLGQYQEAHLIFDAAVAAGDELRRRGNTLEATWGALAARSGRGMNHAAMGDLDAAIADQRAVSDLAIRDRNRIAQAFSQYHLAAHLLERGDLDEADRVASATYAMCLEMGMASRALKCRLVQARVAERQQWPQSMIAHLKEAEALARREQLPDDTWFDVTERLVPALRAHEQHDQAMALVSEARARMQRHANPRLKARARALGVSEG